MGLYQSANRMGTQVSITTTAKSQISMTAATASLRRGCLVDFNVGADGAPNATDCQIVYTVERCTSAGTAGQTLTPNPLNSADAACDAVVGANHSGEPTISASFAAALLIISINQRASQRWVASPGEELIWPATNVNGLSIRALSPTYASNVGVSAIHNDL